VAAVRVRNMARGLFVPVGRIMCLTPGLLSFVLRDGVVMARHRRPPLTVVPPPELLSFDPDEWPAEQWWQSCELWGRGSYGVCEAASGFGAWVCFGCVA